MIPMGPFKLGIFHDSTLSARQSPYRNKSVLQGESAGRTWEKAGQRGRSSLSISTSGQLVSSSKSHLLTFGVNGVEALLKFLKLSERAGKNTEMCAVHLLISA